MTNVRFGWGTLKTQLNACVCHHQQCFDPVFSKYNRKSETRILSSIKKKRSYLYTFFNPQKTQRVDKGRRTVWKSLFQQIDIYVLFCSHVNLQGAHFHLLNNRKLECRPLTLKRFEATCNNTKCPSVCV